MTDGDIKKLSDEGLKSILKDHVDIKDTHTREELEGMLSFGLDIGDIDNHEVITLLNREENKMNKITKVEINASRTKTSYSSIILECIIKEDDKAEAVIKSFEVEVLNNGYKVNDLQLIESNKAKIEVEIINVGNYTIFDIEPTNVGAVCDRYIIFYSKFIANGKTYTLKSEKIYLLQPLKF